MATIRDVAKQAGVSTATVSRVMNHSAYVEPVTIARVEKSMRELGYRRNLSAQAIAARSGNILGLLTGNLADPFFARLARGVEDMARQEGFRLMVCSGGHEAEQEKSGIEFLINQGCEAIVAHATRLTDEQLLRYCATTPAMVVINRHIQQADDRCIWLDNVDAAERATRHLLEQGHRRIACVTTSLPIADRADRLKGYRNALQAYGITPGAGWIISVPFDEAGGELAADMLPGESPGFTAAFTFNDVMAAGIMNTLQRKGVSVPSSLSLVGFDDVIVAKYLSPALTTIHYPVERMAREATSLALRIFQQQDISAVRHCFQAELIIRDSVLPCV
jgi:LacI family transcriptional regulator